MVKVATLMWEEELNSVLCVLAISYFFKDPIKLSGLFYYFLPWLQSVDPSLASSGEGFVIARSVP